MLHITACACILVCHLTKTAYSFLKIGFTLPRLDCLTSVAVRILLEAVALSSPVDLSPCSFLSSGTPRSHHLLSGVSASPSIKCLWHEDSCGQAGVIWLLVRFPLLSAVATEQTGVKCGWHRHSPGLVCGGFKGEAGWQQHIVLCLWDLTPFMKK